MSKKISYTVTYPKPIDQAWADLANPQFQTGKLLHIGAKDPKVTITPRDGDVLYVELDRQNPVPGVPSAVKKITGEWQHVVERVTWGPAGPDGTRTAELSVEFAGVPLGMTGSLTLAPAGQTTRLTLDAEFKSSVPLVGGKLESTAADQSKASLDSEAEFSGQFTG